MSIKSVIKHLSVIAPDLIIMEHENETASAEEAAEVHGVLCWANSKNYDFDCRRSDFSDDCWRYEAR